MTPPDRGELALLRGSYKKHTKKFIWGTVTLVVGIWIAYITQIVIQNLTSTTDLEYKITRYKITDWLPQNAADVVQLKYGDQLLTDAEFVTVELWNRTSTSLERISIRFDTANDPTAPFHKVILVPQSLDRDWVEWANPKENRILEFSVAPLNRNWSKEPNVTVRFFYPKAGPKVMTLKTNRPGVTFADFDSTKSYWWMFGLEGPLVSTGTALLLIILILALWKTGSKWQERQYVGFARVYTKALLENFPEFDSKTMHRLYWIASKLYFYSLETTMWNEKKDPRLKIPTHIGEDQHEQPPKDSSPAEPTPPAAK